MPHFYFDVSQGPKCMPDEQGHVLDRLESAEHEATQTLVQLAGGWLHAAARLRLRSETNGTRRSALSASP